MTNLSLWVLIPISFVVQLETRQNKQSGPNQDGAKEEAAAATDAKVSWPSMNWSHLVVHWAHQVYSFLGTTSNNMGTAVIELEEPNLSQGTFYDKDKKRVSPMISQVS